jgi:TRAP-type mannitol/chloroaromatic compound transport system substrate-binding protein
MRSSQDNKFSETTFMTLQTSNRRQILKAGAAGFAAFTVLPARANVELKLTHPADVSHPVHIEADKMVKRIAERTNGQVKINIFQTMPWARPLRRRSRPSWVPSI